MSDIAQVYELHKRRICVLTFFPVEGAVHSGNCASLWSLLNICQYSTWKSSRETRVKNGFHHKHSAKDRKSKKKKQSKVFFEKRKGENNPTLLE